MSTAVVRPMLSGVLKHVTARDQLLYNSLFGCHPPQHPQLSFNNIFLIEIPASYRDRLGAQGQLTIRSPPFPLCTILPLLLLLPGTTLSVTLLSTLFTAVSNMAKRSSVSQTRRGSRASSLPCSDPADCQHCSYPLSAVF